MGSTVHLTALAHRSLEAGPLGNSDRRHPTRRDRGLEEVKGAEGLSLDFNQNWTNHDWPMKTPLFVLLLGTSLFVPGFTGSAGAQVSMGTTGNQKLSPKQEEAAELKACVQSLAGGVLKVPDTRDQRFQGKVTTPTARCRGGQMAVEYQFTPWVDWSRYWGTGDSSSLPVGFLSVKGPQLRGVAGALTDLEYQRLELIKFNLFDNSGTYQTYISGRGGVIGRKTNEKRKRKGGRKHSGTSRRVDGCGRVGHPGLEAGNSYALGSERERTGATVLKVTLQAESIRQEGPGLRDVA